MYATRFSKFGSKSLLVKRLAGAGLLLAALALLMALLPTRTTAAVAQRGAAPAVAAPDGCTTITFGQTLTGSIDAPAEVDCFIFGAAAGDKVLVRMSRTSGNLWPGIRVYDASGTLLCEASAPTTSEIGECDLPAGGSYTILVSDGFNGTYTGTYSLYLQRLNNPVDPFPIIFNQTLPGSIEVAAEMDTYSFSTSASERVLVRMSRTSGSLWPGLRLYNAGGTLLCDASAPTTSEISECDLPTSGSYTILAFDGFNGTYTGTYSLYLGCLTPPCGPPVTPTPTTPAPTNTPTNTPTSTNTPVPPTATSTPRPPSPTPTSTPLPPTPLPAPPVVTAVQPDHGFGDVPSPISIQGANFANGASARLGSTGLETVYLGPDQLYAVIPAGLTPGTYDLTVTNPDGQQGTLSDAYTVLDPEGGVDDLFGFGYELWSDPIVPYASESAAIGLVVHRAGGRNPLPNVTVRFYRGDPDAGGSLIGEGTIPFLSPRSADSTSAVPWTPPAAGSYTLYAVIDPDNEIAETNEDNNVVSRPIVVLPAPAPGQDLLAPHVDSFLIDDGAATTENLNVSLDTTASDPMPSSGLDELFYVEYEYNQAAGLWVPVYLSGWLDYDAARTDHPWVLVPSPGVKYLQAWVADEAGNISDFPGRDWINYEPPSETVARNQGRIYRYTVAAGQQLTVRVEPSSGDPDLYVWPPDWPARPPWVSDLPGTVAEEVSVVAPVAGEYQIEVYGYTAATYQLAVEITSPLEEGEARPRSGGNGDRPDPTQPMVPLDSVPSRYLVGPPSPATAVVQPVRLPLILR